MKNMKYLLRLLGTLTLTGLSVTTLAACSNPKADPKTDLSQMQSSDITVTKNNIIALNPRVVIQSEVIKGITPSILESIKKITQNKAVTTADFTIALAANDQGDPYQLLDLSPTAAAKTTFVQITSVTKVLSAKTKWLSYLLPKAIAPPATVTDLKDLGTVIPPAFWNVNNIGDIKEQEVISAIRPNILTAVQAINHNSSIVAGDITIQVALDEKGIDKIPPSFAWGADPIKPIYFLVSSTGVNQEVIGQTNETTWLSLSLTRPDVKDDLNIVIETKALGTVVASGDKPSAASILFVVNKLNTTTLPAELTTDDVIVKIISNEKATLTGTEQGWYSGSSANITFTTMPVITALGEVDNHGKPPTDLEILNALNLVNANTPNWKNLNFSDIKIVKKTTLENATVAITTNDFKGILDLTFTIKKTDITGFKTFTPPTDIAFDSRGINKALESNEYIKKAVIDGVNQKFSIDIDETDFTLKVGDPDGIQKLSQPTKITVIASPNSTKITGTFDFEFYLIPPIKKTDITDFDTFIPPTDIAFNSSAKNKALENNDKLIKAVTSGINQKFSIDIDENDFTLKSENPDASQLINEPEKITVIANPTSTKIRGTFDFKITLIAPAPIKKVDITGFDSFTPPTDLKVITWEKNRALESNDEIQEAVVNNINQKFSVNIDKTDFTLEARYPYATQVIETPHQITVIASPTSAKITGTFNFDVYLKFDITPAVLLDSLKVKADGKLTNEALLTNMDVINAADAAINHLRVHLDASPSDITLTLVKPNIATNPQTAGTTIKIIVTANSADIKITGAFEIAVTLT